MISAISERQRPTPISNAIVEATGTLRALTPQDRKLIHDRVRQIATSIAASMGATAEVQIPVTTEYPVTFNNEALTAMTLHYMRTRPGARAAGP